MKPCFPPPKRLALLASAILGAAALSLANRVVLVDGIEFGDAEETEVRANSERSGELPDPAGPHVVEFADGHRLHGTLEALDGERRELRWRRVGTSAAFTFPLPEVSRLSLGAEPTPAPMASRGGRVTVKLIGGDWFVAEELASVTADQIVLRLADSSTFPVPRAQVEWIYFAQKGAAPECYDGPTSLAGFVTLGGWAFRDGALRATSPTQLSRAFDALPDQVEYLVEMKEAGALNSFRVAINPQSESGATMRPIQLRISGNQLHVWAPVGGNFKVEQVDISALLAPPAPVSGMKIDRSRKLQLRLLHDSAGGRFLVFINGRRAGEWTINKGVPGANRGSISFQPMAWDESSEQSISRLRVSPWDGQSEADGAATEAESVTLTNGEIKRGTLARLADESLTLTTESGTVTLPRETARLLRLHPASVAAANAAKPAAVRVRLAGRGAIDATSASVRDGALLLRTRWSDALSLPLAAVRELVFEGARWSALAATDVLLFRNGDQLHGQLESAAPGENVRWRAVAGDAPFFVQPASSLGVRAAARDTESPALATQQAGATVRFKNGDLLTGNLVALDPAQLVLETRDAGQLTIARDYLHSLFFSPEDAPVAPGSAGEAAEWMSGLALERSVFSTRQIIGNVVRETRTSIGGVASPRPNPWRAFDGTFSFAPGFGSASTVAMSPPPLGRTVEEMPQIAEFSFEVRAQRQPVIFAVQAFFEPEVPGYMLQIHGQGLSLQDLSPRRRAGLGFPQQIQWEGKVANDAPQRRVRLLADRPAGKLAVVIDGALVAQIARKPGDGLRNLGRGITLVPQSAVPCSFSNLWVGPWDGRLPGKSGAEPEGGPHSLLLANGDEARGTVESATSKTVKLQSELGAIEIPTARLTMVKFSDLPVEPQPAARLRLRDGGVLTLTSYRVDGGVLHGRTAVAGEIAVPLAAAGEIVFGPETKAKTAE